MRPSFLSWSRAVILLATVGALGAFAGCGGNVITSGSSSGSGASSSTGNGNDTSTGGGACTANGPCQTNADCGAHQWCVYSIADGCAAQGQCIDTIPPPGTAQCGALVEMCGCDGTMVFNAACGWCLADYTMRPTTGKSWPCTDGG